MDSKRIQTVYSWLRNLASRPNWTAMPVSAVDITNIKNGLIKISQDIEKEYPFCSQELFNHKDRLFVGWGTIEPLIFGQVTEVLQMLMNEKPALGDSCWMLIHPQIVKVSKGLFDDGHYANAALDAFIEINDRVKRLFCVVNPSADKIPDGENAMNIVFSSNNPLLEFCDRSTDSGQNTQKGFMQMLAGAMSALRNPKAHANITISQEDAMRRLVFASMLMYKIDEAEIYSRIKK